MTPPTYPDIDLAHKIVKSAYEESVKGNSEKVKDLLLECLVIFSRIHSEPKTTKTKKHKWSFDEEVVGFYLASKYCDTSSFRTDSYTKRLLQHCGTISMGSLQMLIQNFYHLMKKDKGLVSASKLAKEIHSKYKNHSLPKLQLLADDALNRIKTK